MSPTARSRRRIRGCREVDKPEFVHGGAPGATAARGSPPRRTSRAARRSDDQHLRLDAVAVAAGPADRASADAHAPATAGVHVLARLDGVASPHEPSPDAAQPASRAPRPRRLPGRRRGGSAVARRRPPRRSISSSSTRPRSAPIALVSVRPSNGLCRCTAVICSPGATTTRVERERDRLRQSHVHRLESLASVCEDAGDSAAAIRWAQQLIQVDQLHETSYRRLMRLYGTADRACALRTYYDCVSVLERELDVAPSRETTELYDQLLAHGTTARPGGSARPTDGRVGRTLAERSAAHPGLRVPIRRPDVGPEARAGGNTCRSDRERAEQPTPTPSIEVVIRIVVDQSTGDRSVVDVQASTRSDDDIWRSDGDDADGAPPGETRREPTYAEVELVPADSPRRAHPATSREPGPIELVKPRSSRRVLLVVATVAAAFLVVVTMMSSSRPAFTAREVAVSTPGTRPDYVTASAARTRWILLDGENGAPATYRRSPAAASIAGAPCAELIVAAALTLRTDPVTWIASVLEGGGRHRGQTLDQAIRDRLVSVRSTLDRGPRLRRWSGHHDRRARCGHR